MVEVGGDGCREGREIEERTKEGLRERVTVVVEGGEEEEGIPLG